MVSVARECHCCQCFVNEVGNDSYFAVRNEPQCVMVSNIVLTHYFVSCYTSGKLHINDHSRLYQRLAVGNTHTNTKNPKEVTSFFIGASAEF